MLAAIDFTTVEVWTLGGLVTPGFPVAVHTARQGAFGLLMEGVSQIDAMFGVILGALWTKLDSGGKQALIKYLKDKLKERVKKSDKALQRFPDGEDEFWEHADTKFVSVEYDTVTRWKVVRKGLELIKYEEDRRAVFEQLLEGERGANSLIRLRNNYAHKTRAALEESHNDALCIDIRRELRRQLENMAFLEKNVSLSE